MNYNVTFALRPPVFLLPKEETKSSEKIHSYNSLEIKEALLKLCENKVNAIFFRFYGDKLSDDRVEAILCSLVRINENFSFSPFALLNGLSPHLDCVEIYGPSAMQFLGISYLLQVLTHLIPEMTLEQLQNHLDEKSIEELKVKYKENKPLQIIAFTDQNLIFLYQKIIKFFNPIQFDLKNFLNENDNCIHLELPFFELSIYKTTAAEALSEISFFEPGPRINIDLLFRLKHPLVENFRKLKHTVQINPSLPSDPKVLIDLIVNCGEVQTHWLGYLSNLSKGHGENYIENTFYLRQFIYFLKGQSHIPFSKLLTRILKYQTSYPHALIAILWNARHSLNFYPKQEDVFDCILAIENVFPKLFRSKNIIQEIIAGWGKKQFSFELASLLLQLYQVMKSGNVENRIELDSEKNSSFIHFSASTTLWQALLNLLEQSQNHSAIALIQQMFQYPLQAEIPSSFVSHMAKFSWIDPSARLYFAKLQPAAKMQTDETISIATPPLVKEEAKKELSFVKPLPFLLLDKIQNAMETNGNRKAILNLLLQLFQKLKLHPYAHGEAPYARIGKIFIQILKLYWLPEEKEHAALKKTISSSALRLLKSLSSELAFELIFKLNLYNIPIENSEEKTEFFVQLFSHGLKQPELLGSLREDFNGELISFYRTCLEKKMIDENFTSTKNFLNETVSYLASQQKIDSCKELLTLIPKSDLYESSLEIANNYAKAILASNFTFKDAQFLFSLIVKKWIEINDEQIIFKIYQELLKNDSLTFDSCFKFLNFLHTHSTFNYPEILKEILQKWKKNQITTQDLSILIKSRSQSSAALNLEPSLLKLLSQETRIEILMESLKFCTIVPLSKKVEESYLKILKSIRQSKNLLSFKKTLLSILNRTQKKSPSLLLEWMFLINNLSGRDSLFELMHILCEFINCFDENNKNLCKEFLNYQKEIAKIIFFVTNSSTSTFMRSKILEFILNTNINPLLNNEFFNPILKKLLVINLKAIQSEIDFFKIQSPLKLFIENINIFQNDHRSLSKGIVYAVDILNRIYIEPNVSFCDDSKKIIISFLSDQIVKKGKNGQLIKNKKIEKILRKIIIKTINCIGKRLEEKAIHEKILRSLFEFYTAVMKVLLNHGEMNQKMYKIMMGFFSKFMQVRKYLEKSVSDSFCSEIIPEFSKKLLIIPFINKYNKESCLIYQIALFFNPAFNCKAVENIFKINGIELKIDVVKIVANWLSQNNSLLESFFSFLRIHETEINTLLKNNELCFFSSCYLSVFNILEKIKKPFQYLEPLYENLCLGNYLTHPEINQKFLNFLLKLSRQINLNRSSFEADAYVQIKNSEKGNKIFLKLVSLANKFLESMKQLSKKLNRSNYSSFIENFPHLVNLVATTINMHESNSDQLKCDHFDSTALFSEACCLLSLQLPKSTSQDVLLKREQAQSDFFKKLYFCNFSQESLLQLIWKVAQSFIFDEIDLQKAFQNYQNRLIFNQMMWAIRSDNLADFVKNFEIAESKNSYFNNKLTFLKTAYIYNASQIADWLLSNFSNFRQIDKTSNLPFQIVIELENIEVLEVMLKKLCFEIDDISLLKLFISATSYLNQDLTVKVFEKLTEAFGKERFLHICTLNYEENEEEGAGYRLIHFCAKNLQLKALDYLLKNGIDKNLTEKKGNSVLHLICQQAPDDETCCQAIQKVLEYGPNRLATNLLGNTPALLTCQNNYPNTLEILLSDVAQLQPSAEEAISELFISAASSGSMAIFEKLILILKRFGYHTQDLLPLLNRKNDLSINPLLMATLKQNFHFAAALLDLGVDPFVRDHQNRTALDLAVFTGFVELGRYIISKMTCPMSVKNDEEMFNLLPSIKSPLHWAFKEKSVFVIKMLLNYGISPLHQDSEGQTPLHYASNLKNQNEDDQLKRIVLLILKFAEKRELVESLVNRQDNNGDTALHLALKNENIPVISILYSKTNLNIKNQDNLTPYLLAVKGGNKEILELFKTSIKRRKKHK